MTSFASRRQFLAGAAGTVAALAGGTALTACGSGGTGGGGGGEGAADAGVVNVWGGVPAANGPRALIDAFAKKYPKIKVNYTQFVNDPNGNVKLDTALQGGAKIDVLFTYGFDILTKRANSGQLLDITDRIKNDSDLSHLNSSQISPFFGGKLYAVPTVAEASIVYVNKDMAEKAGVQIPDSWTDEEFHEAARRMSSRGVYGAFTAPVIAIPTLGQDATYTDGGSKANFTASPWKTEVELASAMAKDGSTFPESQVLAQQLAAYSQNAFLSGKTGLWISGTYSARFVRDTKQYPHSFVTSFAPHPAPSGVASAWNPSTNDNLISVAKKSANQAAAWTFVKYWLTDGAKFLYQAGKIPTLQTDDANTVTASILGDQASTVFDVDAFIKVCFDDKPRLGVPTQFRGLAEITTAKTAATQQLLLGKLSPDQWVSSMQSKATAAIAKDQ